MFEVEKMKIEILLKNIRKERGLSLEKLAKMTGISSSHLNYIENNEKEVYERVQQKSYILKISENIVDILNERELEIICKRYGLYDGREYTQKEIAKKMGISRSYVSRIEKKALEKLKEFL